jgi:hypothetical protein
MKTTTRLLAAVLVLQGVILLGKWSPGGNASPAYAQIPDAGSQRAVMIEELKNLRGSMDKLVGFLESGKLQVQVVKPDEKK